MRGQIRDARNYELMTIFTPDVGEDEIQSTIDRVVGYITSASGEGVEINRDSPWGRRRLAYPIRHASRDVRDGFYTLYHFQVAPHRVEDIEREIKLNDRIMRYLLTQYTPAPVTETPEATEGGETAATERDPDAVVGTEARPEEAASPTFDDAPAGAVTIDEEAAVGNGPDTALPVTPESEES